MKREVECSRDVMTRQQKRNHERIVDPSLGVGASEWSFQPTKRGNLGRVACWIG